MIDFIMGKGSNRLYKYLGKDAEYYDKYLKLSVLHRRSESNVSRPTLGMRLTMGIKFNHWDTVMECLTTEAIVGFPKGERARPRTNIDSGIVKDTSFKELMTMMPVHGKG